MSCLHTVWLLVCSLKQGAKRLFCILILLKQRTSLGSGIFPYLGYYGRFRMNHSQRKGGWNPRFLVSPWSVYFFFLLALSDSHYNYWLFSEHNVASCFGWMVLFLFTFAYGIIPGSESSSSFSRGTSAAVACASDSKSLNVLDEKMCWYELICKGTYNLRLLLFWYCMCLTQTLQ